MNEAKTLDLTVEREIYKITKELISTNNLLLKTELEDSEIKVISVLIAAADFFRNKYNIKLEIDTLIQKLLELRVSHKRRGREELVKVITAKKEEEVQRENIVKKLLGI